MSEIKKILYPSKIEENNLGDILINGLLVRELTKNKEVFFKGKPNQQLLDLITYNNKYSHNIKIINQINISNSVWKSKLQTLAYIIQGPKFYMVFDTPGHLSGNKSMFRNLLKSFFEISKIMTYLSLSTKYVKYGITLGPYSELLWKFQKIIAKLSFLIVVRDQKNADLLIAKGLKNTMLKPDLAFLLANENGVLANNEKKTPMADFSTITVSLRGSLVGKSLDEIYFKKITDDTISLINKLKKLKKITKINISYQVDADQKTSFLLEKILKEKLSNIEIFLYKEILNFKEAANLYRSSDIVITNRLHVFLFAMACDTKSYIVTDIINHMKLISIAKDLNMDSLIYTKESLIDWNIDIVDEFLITAKGFSNDLQEHIGSL